MAMPGEWSSMTAVDIDGRAVAARVRAQVAAGAAAFELAHGRQPALGTLLVGDDPASATYIRMKHKACTEVGIGSIHRTLPSDATQAELMAAIAQLVDDDAIDGVLVQMPLPGHLDAGEVVRAVPPSKDVDGFHPESVGALALGEPLLHAGTPAGVLTLLDEYGVELEGLDTLVIGRSRVVGLPMSLMLMARNATVTVAHHLTRDLASLVRRADLVVSATGVAGLVTADMVRPGAIVIDVGTIRTEHGLVGDVDYAGVREVAGMITPVPGGVGPMTIATLLECTLAAAEARLAAATAR